MEAGSGSTMPRYSEPSAYSRSIEVFGGRGFDLVAVVERTAGIGHDDFAHVEALQNLCAGVGHQPNPNVTCLDGVSFDDLNRQMVNGGAGDRHTATAFGIDAGAREHADLERGIGQRYPDMAELVGAVNFRRNQPDASGQVRRVVATYPYRRARIEFQHVDGRDLCIQFEFVVDGNAKHRSGLRRGRCADDSLDLGDESGGRRAQRDRRLAAASWRARLL